MLWPALPAASARDESARLPFFFRGRPVGSVAKVHRPLLETHAPWVECHDGRIACAQADEAAFATLHRVLREAGAIRAWRDEPFALFDPATLEPLATIERAATRFWGTLTLGAHATGYVRGNDGRPSHLWIARRSPTKATDPGRLDNLIGGGVPAGQSPTDALVREGFEEAGLSPSQLAGAATAGPRSVLRLARDIPEGFQHEWLYSFDVELPPSVEPRNQDGEVAGFTLMTAAEVRRLVEHADEMTTDAALVTIDFLHRHGLIRDEAAARSLRALRVQVPAR